MFVLMSSTLIIRSGIVCSTWFQCSSYSEHVSTSHGLCPNASVLPLHLVLIQSTVSPAVVLVLPTLRHSIDGEIFGTVNFPLF